MSDNRTQKGQQDRNRINIREDYDLSHQSALRETPGRQVESSYYGSQTGREPGSLVDVFTA